MASANSDEQINQEITKSKEKATSEMNTRIPKRQRRCKGRKKLKKKIETIQKK